MYEGKNTKAASNPPCVCVWACVCMRVQEQLHETWIIKAGLHIKDTKTGICCGIWIRAASAALAVALEEALAGALGGALVGM